VIANNISGLTQVSTANVFAGTGIITNISASGTVSAATVIANNISGLTQVSTANVFAGNLSVSSNINIGDGKLFVDSTTGNVGIGTSSPTANIHVYSNTGGVNSTILVESANVAQLTLKGDRNNTGGEPGGALINLLQDGGSGFRFVLSSVQLANTIADGTTYTGTSNNSLLIGTLSTGSEIGFGVDSYVAMKLESDGDLAKYSYGDTTDITLSRANGTALVPTQTLANDIIGGIYGRGHIGSDWSGYPARMIFVATESYTSAAQGMRIVFSTTSTGSITRVDRMTIADNGNVGIGTATPISRLHVIGDATISTGISTAAMFVGNVSVSGTVSAANIIATNISALTQVSSATVFAGNLSVSSNVNIGAGKMFVNSSTGNVGIGTVTPVAPLHIYVPALSTGNATTSPQTTLELTWVEAVQDLGIGEGTKFLMSHQLVSGTKYEGAYLATYKETGGDTNTSTSLIFGTRLDDANVTTTATERMRITSNGYVGIGTTTPTKGYLEVASVVQQANLASSRFFNTTTTLSVATVTTPNVSIFGSEYIWSSTGFIASSDRRIKANITEINDDTALNAVRLLKPSMYNYIDTISRTSEQVYGFIAQEVKEVLPYSVQLKKEIVPNIYSVGTITNQGVITLSVEHSLVSGESVRLIMKSGDVLTLIVCSVIDSYSFSVDMREAQKYIPEESQEIFIYGKEVEDFHVLQKDAIFTVGISAIQELDRRVQQLQHDNQQLQNQVSELQSQMISMRNQFIELMNTLATS